MLERYLTPEMERIWAPKNRYDQWLRVELAACRAMEERGIVPVGTADSVAPLVTIDPRRIDEIEAITRHDVIAFLT
ncbi:adenylosuccinate lyase, partial [Myxococcota bacterium]|nr:adenylosuccinate lyase [Myxococcota bacterium]